MKLTFLLPLLIGFCLTANAQIVITEIMYNPPEGGADSLEYIELYNNGNNSVNLENWSMVGVNLAFPAVSINPGAYQLIAVKSSAMQSVFGVSAIQWTSGGLNNTGETVAILNPAGDTIDKVSYLAAAPWPSGANSMGPSLVLCNPNTDNNNPANWQDCSTATGIIINGKELFANPGAAANCPTGVLANDDIFSLPPWQSGVINVLANDFVPSGLAPILNIISGPAHGSASLNPDDAVVYTPTSSYCGPDVIRYRVCVGADCDTAQINITVRCYPLYDIETVSNENIVGVADSLNVSCELRAIAYGVNQRPTGLQFTIINNNNKGMALFLNDGNFGYTVQEGDLVAVRGVINQFNGLTQMSLDTVIKISSGNPLVSANTVTVLSEDTESSLTRVANLRLVNPAQWTTGMGTGGFNVAAVSDDHPTDTIQIRIDNDIDLYNLPAPNSPFNITGIGGQFDNSVPVNDGGYQLLPRYSADIQPIVGVKNADFSAFVQIAPNPVANILSIIPGVSFDRVQIFSAAGFRLASLENIQEPLQIDMGAYPQGVYFVRFEKEGRIWTTRVVKSEK